MTSRDERRLPACAVDRVDRRHGAQGSDDVGQVLHAADFDIDDHFEEVSRAFGETQVINVAVVLGDDGRQGAERAGFVRHGQQQSPNVRFLAAV